MDKAMQRRGVGPTELARRIGVRQATVSAWFSDDKPAEPKTEQLSKVPAALKISGHWLLTGEGSMEGSPQDAQVVMEEIRRLVESPTEAAAWLRATVGPEGGGDPAIPPGAGELAEGAGSAPDLEGTGTE